MPLHVDESGTPGAPSLVFLHGVGTSGWMWWRQIAALTDFHCLTVDLPGHGLSHDVPWVSLADSARQVAEVIAVRATQGRAHVVGLSLGAYVALLLLEHHTMRVQRAILSGVTAAPMPNRILLKPQLALMWIMKQRRVARWQAGMLNLSPDEQRAFTDNLAAMSMQTYRRIAEEVVVFRLFPLLQQVDTPVLVTAGGSESDIILQAVEAIPKGVHCAWA